MTDPAFDGAFERMPIVAILRGLIAEDAPGIADALISTGIELMEIPLNTPDALLALAALQGAARDRAIVGAGTVLSPADVARAAGAGATFVVSPNTDAEVIRAAKAARLVSIPGVTTPTEMFAALNAGADLIKLFPMDLISPSAVRAMRAVVPATLRMVAVGGMTADVLPLYRKAGISGIGLGQALYSPGVKPDAVASRAHAFVRAWMTSNPP